MVATDYGSLDLGQGGLPATERSKRARKVFMMAIVLFAGTTALLSALSAQVPTDVGQVQIVANVEILNVPDCQCLSTCNTPDASHSGSWCYHDTDISPCMSSTHRPVYGATWSHCTVIYGEDDCAGDPCKNEAFCLDKYDAYDCICRPGWSGDACGDEIMVEYTIHLVTSSLENSETENAIFIQFIGTEGDMIKEQVLTSTGLGAFERSKKDIAAGKDGCPNLTMKTESNPDGNPGVLIKTITAQDVGELHKVTYRVAGDDSFKPSRLQVEHKGVMHAAVGELAASEHETGVSITMVRARKYTLDVNAVDTPEWAGTAADINIRLTGTDWEVSGEVVAVPGGLEDAVTCQVEFYGADVGTPAKITYWVNSGQAGDAKNVADDFLPGLMMVDAQYKAEITVGERCYGAEFQGNDDGRGYAFQDATCLAGDTTLGCSGVVDCRTCAMWDPESDSSEVLCPWVLPFTDGRFIIVDLVDTQAAVTTTVRFPNVDFTACCGSEALKLAFLTECSATYASQGLTCKGVAAGSAIVEFAGTPTAVTALGATAAGAFPTFGSYDFRRLLLVRL